MREISKVMWSDFKSPFVVTSSDKSDSD
jgi:hypothetical protein